MLFSTKVSSPYDVALVQLRDSAPKVVVPQLAQSFNPGLILVLCLGNTIAFNVACCIIKCQRKFHFLYTNETFLRLMFSLVSLLTGESVLVVGYGGLGRRCGPSLTCGILSKAINLNYQPVMLQTTCAVQAGASGGAVVRTRSGELLGKKPCGCKIMFSF